MKKSAVRIKKSRVETVGADAAKHAKYRQRMVYIPPSESNDNAGYFHVSENVDINLMDSWLTGDGFDGRHHRTAHRCRDYWNKLAPPTRKVVEWEGDGHARASRTLAKMKRAAGPDWVPFENAMRWNEPMGYLGSRFANPHPEYIAATKALVRRVLEIIA